MRNIRCFSRTFHLFPNEKPRAGIVFKRPFQNFYKRLAVYFVESEGSKENRHWRGKKHHQKKRQEDVEEENYGTAAQNVQKLLQGQWPENFILHFYELRHLKLVHGYFIGSLYGSNFFFIFSSAIGRFGGGAAFSTGITFIFSSCGTGFTGSASLISFLVSSAKLFIGRIYSGRISSLGISFFGGWETDGPAFAKASAGKGGGGLDTGETGETDEMLGASSLIPCIFRKLSRGFAVHAELLRKI